MESKPRNYWWWWRRRRPLTSSSSLALQPGVGFSLLHTEGFVTIIIFWCGTVSPTPNPQPGGAVLHICIPWRLSGPVTPPGTEYHFSRLLRHAWATVGLFFSPVTTRGTSNL
jgi:hypothetical protein